jgi:Methyltransferase domain
VRWEIKAVIQGFVAIFPGNGLNHGLQIVNGGHTADSLYAGFARQRDKIRALKARFPIEGKTVVEIGTGWNGAGIVALALEGAGEIHSFDQTRHLRFPIMRRLIETVVQRQPEYEGSAAKLLQTKDLDGLLRGARARYNAPGDATATGLPDRSVDLVFSYNVLEHIPPKALDGIVRESARILKGRAFHNIGIGDHAAVDPRIDSTHFLKLPPLAWKLVNNRFAYHNRLRASHYVEMFTRHGGRIICRQDIIDERALAQKHLWRVHTDLAPEDVAISRMDVDVVFDHATPCEVI